MKLLGASLALVSSIAFGTTFSPVSLLNPAGSSNGQVIISSGASSAPGWGNISAASLGAQAANTVLANATGSSASPTAFPMPSCATALQWTSATGFTCNSSGAFTTLSASTANPSLLYNQGGTGAVNRTYQSKFQETISVKDFGATGGGSVDDTSAIQAAEAAACSAGGGVIYFPHGTYKVNSSINITCNNIHFVGEDRQSTVIASASTTNNTIAIGSIASPVSSIYISRLSFNPSVTKTNGSEIYSVGNLVDISDIGVNGGWNGVAFDSNGNMVINKLSDFYLQNGHGVGVIVGTTNGLLQEVYIDSGTVTNYANGFVFANVSGAYLSNVDTILSTGDGIQLIPVSGGEVVFVFFDTVLSDSSTGNGWVFQNNGAQALASIVCNKCWAAASHGSAGMLFNSANARYLNGITIQNSIIRANQQHGIYLEAGNNIILDSNQVCNNSGSSSGTYHGIVVQAGVTNFQITNNVSGLCGYDAALGASNNQGYGILIATGASDKYVVTGNRAPSNVTGGVSDGGTGSNKSVANNVNF